VGTGGVSDYAERLIRSKARKLVGKAGFVEADVPDVEQELRLDIWRRLSKFDPKRSKRETFITRLIEHKLASILEHRRAAMRDPHCEGCSLNDPVGDAGNLEIGDGIEDDRRRPKRPATETSDLLHDLACVLDHLPPRLRALAEELKTRTPSEIARKRGVPRGTLYEAIRELRARLADFKDRF